MSTWIAIAGILTVAAATPGPNNFIVMSAAAKHGLHAAISPIGGIVIGGLLLLCIVWLSGALITPGLNRLIGTLGALYLAWLGAQIAWRAMRPVGVGNGRSARLPESWLAVLFFQLVNPKAWTLAVTVTAAARTEQAHWALPALTVSFAAISLVCLALWSAVGSTLSKATGGHRTGTLIDIATGGLLLFSSLGLLASLYNGE